VDQHDLTLNARDGREGGIGLVEVLVALCIIGILMAVSIYSIHGARKSGRYLAAVAVAHAYANAADMFARDHDGRYPAAPGSADWPNAVRGPVAQQLGTMNRYLRSVPESVQSGQVGVHAGATRITYENVGGTGYRIQVTAPGDTPCALTGGSATIGTMRACSTR
jgi:type II secretory pathway pseudopilin PulG